MLLEGNPEEAKRLEELLRCPPLPLSGHNIDFFQRSPSRQGELHVVAQRLYALSCSNSAASRLSTACHLTLLGSFIIIVPLSTLTMATADAADGNL